MSSAVPPGYYDIVEDFQPDYVGQCGMEEQQHKRPELRTPKLGASSPVLTLVARPQPSAPTIASFSNDTGKAGDGVTSDNTLQLKGTAAANSTIKIYDGSTQIGSMTASPTGAGITSPRF